MRLDDADLSILEIDAEKLEPITREIVQALIEQVRFLRDELVHAELKLEDIRGHAFDALHGHVEDVSRGLRAIWDAT